MQKYRSNATAIIADKKIQVKTERDIEQALGIKTERNPTTTNRRLPNVKDSNQGQNKSIDKIVELQKENQRYVLDLKKKDSAYAALQLDKQKTEKQLSEKIISLSAELKKVRSELSSKKSEYSKQNADDKKTISDLNAKIRLLNARNKQLQTGSCQQNTTHANENKSDESQENVFEVEKIIAHKRKKDGMYFLVRWKNYSAKDDTWERESNLLCPSILQEYKLKMNTFS